MIGHAVARLSLPEVDELLAVGYVNVAAHDGYLWFSTSRGIARLSLAAAHAQADQRGPPPAPRVFSAADGLPIGRASFTGKPAMFAARDGRVWFATPGGIAVYDPSDDTANRVAPGVHIEEVVVAGRRVDWGAPVEIPPRPGRSLESSGHRAQLQFGHSPAQATSATLPKAR